MSNTFNNHDRICWHAATQLTYGRFPHFKVLGGRQMPSSSPISVKSNRFERLGGGAEELAELVVDIWALGRDLCDEAQGLRLRNEKSGLDHKTSPEVHKPLQ